MTWRIDGNAVAVREARGSSISATTSPVPGGHRCHRERPGGLGTDIGTSALTAPVRYVQKLLSSIDGRGISALLKPRAGTLLSCGCTGSWAASDPGQQRADRKCLPLQQTAPPSDPHGPHMARYRRTRTVTNRRYPIAPVSVKSPFAVSCVSVAFIFASSASTRFSSCVIRFACSSAFMSCHRFSSSMEFPPFFAFINARTP